MTNGAKTTAALALLMGVSLTTTAKAADFGFSIGFGRPTVRPVVFAPRPVVTMVREWVPERYETREEQILIEPAHVERQYVPEVLETRADRYGHPVTVLVKPGYYAEVPVPARYETRCTKVLMPGFYREVAVNEPVRGQYGDYRNYGNGRWNDGRDERWNGRSDDRWNDRADDRWNDRSGDGWNDRGSDRRQDNHDHKSDGRYMEKDKKVPNVKTNVAVAIRK